MRHRRKPPYKTLQLCRQIERLLCYVLPDCGDEVLAGLSVETVEPAPNASRLLVTLVSADPQTSLPAVLAGLERVRGRLRGEVASAICRKKMPDLVFRCLLRAG